MAGKRAKDAWPDKPKPVKISRRRFLKSVAMTAVGATIANLPAACKSSAVSETTEPNTTPQTTSFSQSSTGPFAYTPPAISPPVITVSGTSCTVATDRLYSPEHVWVLPLPNNRAVLGISQTMYEILYRPYRVETSPIGTKLAKGDGFSSMEGYKMAAEIASPVSGVIIDMNRLAVGYMGEDGAIQALTDSYKTGWMIVVQLSNTAELGSLLKPEDYIKQVKGS
jgi:glycine cleavage system H protein